jgi:APA family basic amino acid/polyamine antiporter
MLNFFKVKSVKHILEQADLEGVNQMKRSLSVRDLTALGIAAIIGAGIFSTIGTAAFNGGPSVSLLFVITAIACGFSALCYAQFASAIPISGSAYTYAYASFGELIAWIIGWDLIMEYAVGNVAVAISWSEYFVGLLSGIGLHIPAWLTVDYLSASRGFHEATQLLNQGKSFSALSSGLQESWLAWTNAPQIGGLKFIADIPAFSIVVAITVLVYIGIQEAKVAGNIMVLIKIIILMIVISVGAFYVDPKNWHPFAPNGFGGMMKGVSGVFFAYIGFDAISTTAEECKNPKRDLPRAMIYALLITTVLYVVISLVLTGMVSYKELGVGDPLSYVFQKVHLGGLSGIIALSAVIAMASVLLVFQVGQPRIWMSMSRDGLLPPRFSKIHRRFKTPAFATIITGVLVAIPTLFMNLTEVTDLTSIGTLFAFVLVSGGVLIMNSNKSEKGSFNVPFVGSRLILPLVWLAVVLGILFYWHKDFGQFLNDTFNSDWNVFKHQVPFLIFLLVAIGVSVLSVIKNLSLIPVLGLLINLYLMSQLGITNWLRFLIWLVIGLVLYFSYGYKHSKLNIENKSGSVKY